MRISDWSSDVCSSDLLLFVAAIALLWLTGTGKRWLAPWHLDGQTSEAFVDFPLVEVRPVIASGKAESGTAEIVTFQLTDHLRRDRKCVVSGKSVSVRLDLGGCLIIKKKTQQYQI